MNIALQEREVIKPKWSTFKQTKIKDVDLFELTKNGNLQYFREIITILKRNHEPLVIKTWINSKNFKGQTPLSIAILNQNKKFVEFLIKMGADVNVEDIHGNTPLMIAALKGNLEILNTLLKNGALINQANYSNLNALDWAIMFGKDNITEYIKKHIPSTQSRHNRFYVSVKFLRYLFI